MARYSSWKGYLKISLVSVPVKAYTATTTGGGTISLNQLHETCHSRIKYKKVCPIHGEVPNDEIVSGYEYTKGQYVVIDPDEIDKLRTESDKSLTVEGFISSDEVDPVYHSGKTYYLVPDGPVGQKPYQLLRQSMAEEGVHAVGRVVLSKREQIVIVRPLENLLAMTVLDYASSIKEPASFEDELVATDASKQEVELTRQLVTALMKEDFDLKEYHDTYTDKLTQLIEAKVEGKEIVAPPAAEEPEIINLMDALKQSVQQVKTPAVKKPERKMAESKTKRSVARKKAPGKKKSG